MMKKLFTSLLLLGVALCSWGQDNPSLSGTTLTVTLGESESFSTFWNNLDKNPSWKGTVKELVLTGKGFTNADFGGSGNVKDLANLCCGDNGTLYLNMEGCTEVVSKVKYTGEGPKDYTSKHFEYDYSVQKTVSVSQQEVYLTTWEGNDYIVPNHAQWNWTDNYDGTYSWNGYIDGAGQHDYTVRKETAWGYYDNGTFVPLPKGTQVDETNNTASISKDLPAFSFGVNGGDLKDYLKGITFPNSPNFTAISNNLCSQANCPNLEDIVISFASPKTNYIEWIGYMAFAGNANENASLRSKLNNVTFPSSLKVIGTDAFFACTKFTVVDLDLPNLVRVDAAAFNMKDTEWNKLETVYLPGNKTNVNNTSLRFFANQVFSSSHITTLDFSRCLGITNFAYDGMDSMGEDDYTPSGEQAFGGSATFTWYASLQTLTLPPNLVYVPGDKTGGNSENASFVAKCSSLKTVIFKGSADYDENCVQKNNNKLIIEQTAFANCASLESVKLSNNVTEIRQHAFEKTGIKEIRIPASVEKVELYAFNLCDNLTTVIFEDLDPNCKCKDEDGSVVAGTPKTPATHIEGDPYGGNGGTSSSGAFYTCQNIQDVYVNNTHQELQCDNYAFNYGITWGHADVQAKFATLHFPKQFAENYANLSHPLTDDIAADPGKFHSWLHTHIHKAVDPNGNGWHEFVNAGPYTGNIDDPDNVCQEIILRTFSDYSYSYIVPDGLRAYVVKEIDANATIPTVTLQRIFVIPARTGVILYGHPNGKNTKGEPVLSLTPVEFAEEGETLDDGSIAKYNHGKALCRANWNDPSNAHAKNYLEPTSTPTAADVEVINNRIARLQKQLQNTTDEAEIQLITKKIQHANADKTETLSLMDQHKDDWKNGGMYVKPFNNQTDVWNVVDTKTTNPVTFRNFGMGRYSKTEESTFRKVPLGANDTDYEAFFRLVPGWFANGKAYLRLKANNDEYDLATGAEIIVKKDEGQGVAVPYYYEYDKNSSEGATINYRDNDHLGNVANNPKHWWDNREQYGFTWEVVDLTGDKHDGRILKNWGERPANFQNKPNFIPTYLGELGEDADGIVKLAIPSEYFNVDNDYYTLQGVKVTNPTKGVYIRNGKKVIIK